LFSPYTYFPLFFFFVRRFLSPCSPTHLFYFYGPTTYQNCWFFSSCGKRPLFLLLPRHCFFFPFFCFAPSTPANFSPPLLLVKSFISTLLLSTERTWTKASSLCTARPLFPLLLVRPPPPSLSFHFARMTVPLPSLYSPPFFCFTCRDGFPEKGSSRHPPGSPQTKSRPVRGDQHPPCSPVIACALPFCLLWAPVFLSRHVTERLLSYQRLFPLFVNGSSPALPSECFPVFSLTLDLFFSSPSFRFHPSPILFFAWNVF